MSLEQKISRIVSQIVDPEIPYLTIKELGIFREVQQKGPYITVVIAPTYLACPATDAIEEEIISKLKDEGFCKVEVLRQYKPSWTTDWITKDGREKMRRFGVNPPEMTLESKCGLKQGPICPKCGACESESLNDVSGTVCKSLFRCLACCETFEHFKCL